MSMSHQPAYDLIILGSIFSYVFAYYATQLELSCEPLFVSMHVVI